MERFAIRRAAGPIVTATGRVVLLNGASSSGKSTLAARLLEDLDSPWFHLSVDAFGAMRSATRTHLLNEHDLAAVLRRTRAGFHRAAAAMAHAGNDVVMDHVLSEPWRLDDLLDVMAEVDVVFVGVHCATGELRRREQARADRPIGMGESQSAVVHSGHAYDVEVDTTTSTAADCSAQIREFLHRNPVGTVRAFDQLRAGRGAGTSSQATPEPHE